MPKKSGRSDRSDRPGDGGPEETRIRAELDFELWQESNPPTPRISVRTSGEGVAAEFDGHVMVSADVWAVRGVLRPHPLTGLLRVESLTVEPCGEAREVTGQVLRSINVAGIRDEAAGLLVWLGDEPEIRFSADPSAPLRVFPDADRPVRKKLVAAARPKSRRGRPSLSEEKVCEAALVYLSLYNEGITRGLMQRVADQLGVARQTAADRVALARKLDFLTPAQKGRAGARPGPRLFDP